jgi:hypothetical protein
MKRVEVVVALAEEQPEPKKPVPKGVEKLRQLLRERWAKKVQTPPAELTTPVVLGPQGGMYGGWAEQTAKEMTKTLDSVRLATQKHLKALNKDDFADEDLLEEIKDRLVDTAKATRQLRKALQPGGKVDPDNDQHVELAMWVEEASQALPIYHLLTMLHHGHALPGDDLAFHLDCVLEAYKKRKRDLKESGQDSSDLFFLMDADEFKEAWEEGQRVAMRPQGSGRKRRKIEFSASVESRVFDVNEAPLANLQPHASQPSESEALPEAPEEMDDDATPSTSTTEPSEMAKTSLLGALLFSLGWPELIQRLCDGAAASIEFLHGMRFFSLHFETRKCGRKLLTFMALRHNLSTGSRI